MTRGQKLAQQLRTAIGQTDLDGANLKFQARRFYLKKAFALHADEAHRARGPRSLQARARAPRAVSPRGRGAEISHVAPKGSVTATHGGRSASPLRPY